MILLSQRKAVRILNRTWGWQYSTKIACIFLSGNSEFYNIWYWYKNKGVIKNYSINDNQMFIFHLSKHGSMQVCVIFIVLSYGKYFEN